MQLDYFDCTILDMNLFFSTLVNIATNTMLLSNFCGSMDTVFTLIVRYSRISGKYLMYPNLREDSCNRETISQKCQLQRNKQRNHFSYRIRSGKANERFLICIIPPLAIDICSSIIVSRQLLFSHDI